MCEQTEISYLDGDVVWVKLRSFWWPGQVVGLEKLPDDIQGEFQRKPIIAAVKFFQEDSFEFVKSYQQIYKYNCTQKEDFIRKGLDKYRIKSREGSNYMDKFPKDVKTAEILTNGDPDIILSEKFSPEEKPDISGLFGEKKVPKKKRHRDETNRKNDDARRKMTHLRFLQGSDHEVRIRQQTTSVPSSSRSGSSFPCHVCGFTVTRVNVAICHLKNHMLNNETADTIKTKTKNNMYSKLKPSNLDSPKRKYLKKSVPGKSKSDTSESVKRKYHKQNDKPSKKKKSDPELKEKLLADWTGDSDEDDSLDIEKQECPNSFDESSINQSSMKSPDETKSFIDNSSKDNSESMDLLQESDKLLEETNSLTKFSILKDLSIEEVKSNLDLGEMEKSNNLKSPKKSKDTFHFKKANVEKLLPKEKNDKEKALLSRFDFHEDEIPEPSISPVRKGARGLGLKKEIIKEFEMQQALKNDEEKDYLQSNPVSQSSEHIEIEKEIIKSEANTENDKRFEKSDEVCETQVEIVEIFEVEKEDEKDIETEIFQLPNEKMDYVGTGIATDQKKKVEIDSKTEKEKNQQAENLEAESERVAEIIQKEPTKKELFEKSEINEDEKSAHINKELINDNLLNIMEDNFSSSDTSTNKKPIIEEKGKAILPVALTFDLQNNSDNYSSQDEDKNTAFHDDLNSNVKKRRGRPRKNRVSTEQVSSDNEHLKFEDSREAAHSMESERKTSESDSDCLNSDKKRKPSRKSQSPLFLQNVDNKLSKHDESFLESDDKSMQEIKNKIKDRKIENSDDINKVEDIKSPLFDSIEFEFTSNIQPKLKGNVKEQNNLGSQGTIDQSDSDLAEKNTNSENLNENDKSDIFESNDDLKVQTSTAGSEELEAQNLDVEQVRPKKFQIKKFEPNKTDSTNKVSSEKTSDSIVTNKLTSTEIIEKNEATEVKKGNQEHFENITVVTEKLKSPSKVESTEQDITEKLRSPCKAECTEQDGAVSSECMSVKEKSENSKNDEIMEDKFNKNVEDELMSASNNKIQNSESNNDTSMKEIQTLIPNQELSTMNFLMMGRFDNIEVVADNDSLKLKSSEGISCDTNNDNVTVLSSNEKVVEKNNLLGTTEIPVTKSSENLKNLSESSSSVSVSSATEVKVIVPVKKREKPRIIENVALKEPMILKTKLIEKHSGKIGKHKLESDNPKLNELKGFSKAKVMKIESVGSSSKSKPLITSGNQNILTKKIIKTIKDEVDTVVSPMLNERIVTSLPKNMSEVQSSEKCIQQSSQSLVDMELDINSMPFVLSEDVLTPESIEQMPVVISSVLPASSTVATIATTSTTSITPMKQTNQALGPPKEMNEVAVKKKSGTPAILKSKSKAKPTITSIKTIVPPLSSAAYKTGFKAVKTPPSAKKTPGKYVIVQTAGQQQAYSTHQKVAIPTSKGSGNAQIVQQGGKVVILSSPQSDQPGQKILPLNSISKALSSGKVQRIITTKQPHPSLTAVSSPNIISSKTLNASKSSDAAPTASSKVVGQKILNQQQLITSKSVLTQMPGTIGKSTVLSSLPQSILTRDGIYTPLNTSTLGGKAIIGSKTLIAKSFSPQSLSVTKNIITPLTTSIAGKTIINSQGLVTKGTVLTPITGSQVKALAAKNIKGNKVQYQPVQRKVQMTTLKNQTIPVSPSSARSAVNVKTGNVVLLQNPELKTVASNKKAIPKPTFQTVKKQTITPVLSPSGALPVQQKSKLPLTNLEAKSVAHKGTVQTAKLQKVIVDKKDEDIELKSAVSSKILVQNVKVEDQANQTKGAVKIDKNVQKNLQKRISNVKSLLTISESVSSAPGLKVSSLESSSHDKIPKRKEIQEQIIPKEDVVTSITQVAAVEVEKTEEPKVSAQTQIMALPTESSDGTQTYVLLTVDDQGRIIPLDNNTLVSLDGTSSFDGSKTLYIDSSSLNESGNIDNIVLQIDNGSLTNIQPVTSTEQTEPSIIGSLSPSEVGQSSNQDILAAALANTDFQHEVNLAEVAGSNTMTSLTQTSLINQTILQSTIIPPTEPISSPLVLETSLTLSQPIMTPLEVPSNVSIQSDLASVAPNMSTRGVNQNALYITMEESLPISNKSMPEIEETEVKSVEESDLHEKKTAKSLEMDISYSVSMCENNYDKKKISTPSLPMIDENFSANSGFDSTNASVVQDNLKNYVTKTSQELIEDLTGNDSLQESSDKSKVESVSNDKSCSEMQELIFESSKGETLQKNQEDECISMEECATTEASENVESSEDRNKEKLTSCETSRGELCNSSLESIMEVESSQEVVIEEQKEQQVQEEQVALKVECGDDVKEEQPNLCQTSEDRQKSSEGMQDLKINFDDSEETPSQSYEEFVSATSDIAEVPSQSAKSESSQEATEGILLEEPPSQSYGDSKHIDAPSQSFNCEMLNEDKNVVMDDPNFPTQSFEVEKMENFDENMESDTERSQEGNIPSQSNEVGEGEGIGTSSAHCALNEDETASSSYVPETPENQERDQDQESAISTSSYEIPPCEELNIASSSVIPDTSVHLELSEHSNIHNNGVPEIPTSSYSLNSLSSLNSLNSLSNPDSSSAHIDAVPTSSYEDQIVLEQNVSTSYQVSLAQLEESSSQNYVTDSSEERNEPTSYYAHHQDVTESYYENVCKESSPRMEAEEAQPSYYGSNPSDETSEASQSYFNQEATPSYGEHEISPSYYDSRTEAEATQSFYSSAAATAASSQSPFYQEAVHEQRLVQGGEATPTDYTDRYSVDYSSVSSPLDRHDLVESSVPARSMDR